MGVGKIPKGIPKGQGPRVKPWETPVFGAADLVFGTGSSGPALWWSGKDKVFPVRRAALQGEDVAASCQECKKSIFGKSRGAQCSRQE